MTRDSYPGSILFNTTSFILLALYSTSSNFWVSNINTSSVVKTEAYAYMSTAAETVNEGLRRAAWSSSRTNCPLVCLLDWQLTHTVSLTFSYSMPYGLGH
jgi:hypothetical protein